MNSILGGHIFSQQYFFTLKKSPQKFETVAVIPHDNPALKCGVILTSEDIFTSSYTEEMPICEVWHFAFLEVIIYKLKNL
jgi:hypothetical protein